jgi:hypothetical protein
MLGQLLNSRQLAKTQAMYLSSASHTQGLRRTVQYAEDKVRPFIIVISAGLDYAVYLVTSEFELLGSHSKDSESGGTKQTASPLPLNRPT